MTFRRERYPSNWRAIRAAILARASGRCECRGECGDAHDRGPVGRDRSRCGAPHRERIVRDPRAPWVWWPELDAPRPRGVEVLRFTRVVLTVAHMNHRENDNRAENLRALCQRCHLRYDARDNIARRRERRAAEGGQLPLPALAVMPEHRRGAP